VDANLAVDIGGKKRFISADYSPFGDTSLLVTQKGRGRFSGNKHRRTTVTNFLGGHGSLRNAFPTGKQKAPVTVSAETPGNSNTIDVILTSGALTNYIRDPTALSSGAVTGGVDEMFVLAGDGTFASIGFPKEISGSGNTYKIETNATIPSGIPAGTDIYVNAFQPGHTYTITGGTQVMTPSFRSFSGVPVTGGSGTGGTANVLFDTSTQKMILNTLYTNFQTGINFVEEDLITFGTISGATPVQANLPARVHIQSGNIVDTGKAQRLIDLIPGTTVESVLAQKGFMLKADHRNTPTIFIGGPTMKNLTGAQLSQYPEGIPLGPADSFFIDVTELSQIYVVADSDPSGVFSYIYWMDM